MNIVLPPIVVELQDWIQTNSIMTSKVYIVDDEREWINAAPNPTQKMYNMTKFVLDRLYDALVDAAEDFGNITNQTTLFVHLPSGLAWKVAEFNVQLQEWEIIDFRYPTMTTVNPQFILRFGTVILVKRLTNMIPNMDISWLFRWLLNLRLDDPTIVNNPNQYYFDYTTKTYVQGRSWNMSDALIDVAIFSAIMLIGYLLSQIGMSATAVNFTKACITGSTILKNVSMSQNLDQIKNDVTSLTATELSHYLDVLSKTTTVLSNLSNIGSDIQSLISGNGDLVSRINEIKTLIGVRLSMM